MARHPLALVACAASVLLCGACAISGGAAESPVPTVGTVAGVGVAPPSIPVQVTMPVTPGTFSTGDTIPQRELPIGTFAQGSRLLLLGDSIFVGLSRRTTNLACDNLVPLGWQVAVEAETGRFVDFGLRVLRERPADTWDVAVVFLGTNYRGNQDAYAADLGRILDEFGDKPVVLLTVTEFQEDRREVNEVIARETLARDNVWVVDWASISEADGVLSGDGIHPSTEGRELLAGVLALMLGQAPTTPGRCLESQFVDDSAGTGGATTDTTSSSGSGSSGGSGGTSAPKTDPPATDPPATDPPATDPPPTDPPATNAASTDPPGTTAASP